MKISDYTQSALLKMLVNVIDANYGIKVHDIGNSDGLREEDAADIREFWETFLTESRMRELRKKAD